MVTAISRRGVNPKPNSEILSQVNWIQGDATDSKVVEKVLKDSDAAVHAIGTCTLHHIFSFITTNKQTSYIPLY
jgi:nucleoside-diphosphate-sugar epimerase